MTTDLPPDLDIAEASIYAALGPIFSEIFGRDVALSAGLTAKDVMGWDSFRQIEIIIAAEQRFGFKFASSDIDGLRTLGDLVAIVAKHQGAEGRPGPVSSAVSPVEAQAPSRTRGG